MSLCNECYFKEICFDSSVMECPDFIDGSLSSVEVGRMLKSDGLICEVPCGFTVMDGAIIKK